MLIANLLDDDDDDDVIVIVITITVSATYCFKSFTYINLNKEIHKELRYRH